MAVLQLDFNHLNFPFRYEFYYNYYYYHTIVYIMYCT